MTTFWILAFGLVGLALLFVLPPLFSKRALGEDVNQDALNLAVFHQQLQELDADLAAGELDQLQYKAARRDLERELLHDVRGTETELATDNGSERRTAVLIAAALPTVAIALYLYLGSSSIIPHLDAVASSQAQRAHQGQPGQMPPLEVMVQRLADKLERNPDNLEGWMMLGRTYFAIGQPKRALYALGKAYGLEPGNPDVLVAYAEAIAANNDSELAGRPTELIQAALRIDPGHTKARWLEGLVSFQGAKYAQAAEQWGALVATLDPRSEEVAELKHYIAEARSRSESPPGRAPRQISDATNDSDNEQVTQPLAADAENEGKRTTSQAVAPSASVTVEVSLAEPLRPQVTENDSLFIYAKAVAGPPMPLAVHRTRVAELPLTVTLDDSMAMTPATKLSGFDQVTVGARISKSGQALPQRGDLEGKVSPVKPGQSGIVKILIDRVRP